MRVYHQAFYLKGTSRSLMVMGTVLRLSTSLRLRQMGLLTEWSKATECSKWDVI